MAATVANNLPSKQQVRNLNVHEYISYTLLRDHGIPVPKFNVAKTKEEACKYALDLNTEDIVLKAQVSYKNICTRVKICNSGFELW